ncbi:MAG TPA: type II toxin-antitoxin system VapC family toxin [Blastocatellia bacterium]|nr:type II toxin-antitoxin system VapC family toxin [Blastocatellia bacterium]
MNLLLDTHVFLWFISGDKRLPNVIRDSIRDSQNEVYLSVASIWEAIIKNRIGKLPLPASPEIYLPTQRERHFISSLFLDEASVMRLAGLPGIHRDPFDRILICQALQHDLTIATTDDAICAYSCKILR